MQTGDNTNLPRLSFASLSSATRQGGFIYTCYVFFGCLLSVLFSAGQMPPQERALIAVRRLKTLMRVPLSVGALSILIVQVGDLPPAGFWILSPLLLLYFFFKKARFILKLRKAKCLMEERVKRDEVHGPREWKDYPVSDAVRSAVEIARKGQREFLLAQIDMSGRAHCEYGELPYLRSVPSETLTERDRYNIDIVLFDEFVLLRKNYRGDKNACLTEWLHLERMVGKASVPVVWMVDIIRTVLYMDYIYGKTMLEILRDKGAFMRDSDVENDPDFIGLDKNARQQKLDERSTQLLPSCFPEQFFGALDDLIDAVHNCRLTDLDIRFANILVDDGGKPWMIDFHEAKVVPHWLDWLFRIKRDGDFVNYNRIFRRNRSAESSTRKVLSERQTGNWNLGSEIPSGSQARRT